MTGNRPARVFMQEVSVRDGFQIEPRFIPTADKIALVDRLSRTGLAKIEVTSFSSPKAIPGLADAGEVMAGIERVVGVEYAVLVPNLRGCERALAHRPDEINLVLSASDTHGLANLRMTPEQSLAQFADILTVARGEAAISAAISTAFGCPFEGDVPEARLFAIVDRLAGLGIDRISLCDTTGMANPAQVEAIFAQALARWPAVRFTAHFHDTRAMGLANALAALTVGVAHFDASLGGLGGCPFAPGASGNVCTEDMVHMFEAMGCRTGVDLTALLEAAALLPGLTGHAVPGYILKAGPASRRYPRPAGLGEAN
jgi:hydroxymethylglutaryl-CoA lyase